MLTEEQIKFLIVNDNTLTLHQLEEKMGVSHEEIYETYSWIVDTQQYAGYYNKYKTLHPKWKKGMDYDGERTNGEAGEQE